VAARLKERYTSEVLPKIKEQYGITNTLAAPRLEKVVINMGVGDAVGDPRLMETAATELAAITGQKASIRAAKKSISNFKLRQGLKIGCMVTLRGDRMYEFMDRLFNIAMPRIRDFRGTPTRSFDKFGNYTLGLREQTIFPEVDFDKVMKPRGMNITFVIKNSSSAEQSRELLRGLGMPFMQ
jgi:large subunit ribosomal protein L5